MGGDLIFFPTFHGVATVVTVVISGHTGHTGQGVP